MNVNIDKRTIANIASGGNATYAHGLPGTPDTVDIRFVATIAVTTNWIRINARVDPVNVTLYNDGTAGSGVMEVCAMQFHSLIQ
jgi:hypothetical protein